MTNSWHRIPPAAGTRAYIWCWSREILATWTVIDGGMSCFWLTESGEKWQIGTYWRAI